MDLVRGHHGGPLVPGIARTQRLFFIGFVLLVMVKELQGIGFVGIGDLALHGNGDGNRPSDGNGHVAAFGLDDLDLGPGDNRPLGKGSKVPFHQGKELGGAKVKEQDDEENKQDPGDSSQPGRAAGADGMLQVHLPDIAGGPVADGTPNGGGQLLPVQIQVIDHAVLGTPTACSTWRAAK